MNSAVAVTALILLFAMGAPLFIVIAAASLLTFTYVAQVDPMAIIGEMYRLTTISALVALPLFTFAGYLLSESRTPTRLVNLANAFLGNIRGGVAIAALVTCAAFTAFSGASGVTIVALGGLLFPVLMGTGYQEKFSLGLITSSGSLGLLFPPSLPVILYAIVAKVSVQQTYVAGIVPGILIVLILSVFCVLVQKLQGAKAGNPATKSQEKPSFSGILTAVRNAAWEIPLGFMIPGLIYFGICTISEVAVITVLYVFFIEVFAYRDIRLKDVPQIAVDSMVMIGAIMIIMGIALGFTNFLLHEEIPMKALDLIKTHIGSRVMFLLALNVFLIIVGMIMDIFSAILVIVPLIVPVAIDFGVNPVHLGIIFLVNLEIGYCTPPVGINLFISSIRFDRSVIKLYRATFGFLVLLVLALLLVTYFPELSLWLTRLLTGPVERVGVLG